MAAARAANVLVLVLVLVARSAYFDLPAAVGAVALGTGLGQRNGWMPAAPRRPATGRITLSDLAEWHERHGRVLRATR